MQMEIALLVIEGNSTVNFEIIDKVGMPNVLYFISGKLEPYDTSKIEWVKLLPLNREVLLHGECKFPVSGSEIINGRDRGYRIRASVNVEMSPPFSFIHWGREYIEAGCQKWLSKEAEYLFSDLEECAVHTLSHECFHFLSDSGQVEEKNYEANANWWADCWLEDFKSKS